MNYLHSYLNFTSVEEGEQKLIEAKNKVGGQITTVELLVLLILSAKSFASSKVIGLSFQLAIIIFFIL